MQEHIAKGLAQRVPKEELDVKERPVWYLPRRPMTHPLKPGKVRVVYDCGAKYRRTSLNQQLLQGPDLKEKITPETVYFLKSPIKR